MSFSMNILYRGENGNAAAFAREMQESGIAERIRKFRGCLGYEYFISLSDPETVLLIDRWEDQKALDTYHASPIMAEVAALREKYDLHMKAERFIPADMPSGDRSFIRE